MCMQKIYDNISEPNHHDDDTIFNRFIEKASEIEISRFANDECSYCRGRGLYENVLDQKSGYYELCACDCIYEKEHEIKRYIGVINEKE